MIAKAVYDNESEVPAAFKDDYTKRADGKWVMKDDAVPGAAELFNPGLAANRDRALTQKTAAEEAKRAAESRANELQQQLDAVRAPGSVVLSPTDAKVWERVQKLGDVKEVERIVTVEFPRLQAGEQLRDRQKAWGKAGEELKAFGVNLNLEALSDLMTHPQRGAGLEIESRPVEVDNGQGQKVTVNFPHIVERVKAASGKEGEFELKATPLLDYAQANWPAWAVQALTSGQPSSGGDAANALGATGEQTGNLLQLSTGQAGGATTGGAPATGGGQTFTGLQLPGAQGGGLKLPAMGAGASSTGGAAAGNLGDPNKVAETFNTRRDGGRTSPLSRGTQQQPAAGGQPQK